MKSLLFDLHFSTNPKCWAFESLGKMWFVLKQEKPDTVYNLHEQGIQKVISFWSSVSQVIRSQVPAMVGVLLIGPNSLSHHNPHSSTHINLIIVEQGPHHQLLLVSVWKKPFFKKIYVCIYLYIYFPSNGKKVYSVSSNLCSNYLVTEQEHRYRKWDKYDHLNHYLHVVNQPSLIKGSSIYIWNFCSPGCPDPQLWATLKPALPGCSKATLLFTSRWSNWLSWASDNIFQSKAFWQTTECMSISYVEIWNVISIIECRGKS